MELGLAEAPGVEANGPAYSTASAPLAASRPRSARRWLLRVGGFLILLVALAAVAWGPAILAQRRYDPLVGDVLFQSLPRSRVVVAIEGATRSPFSHCGIVAIRDGKWVVYEAYRGVEITPLNEFLWRGRDAGFAAYRLKADQQQHAAETLVQAAKFLGRPYDSRYRLDDEKIYCSELIYKAFRAATNGVELGSLVRLGDLAWQPYEQTIRYLEGGGLPLDREMITPRNLALADQLELVYSHRIATETKP